MLVRAAAVTALLMLAATAQAGSAPWPEFYPGAQRVRVGDELVANGRPMRLEYFVTEDAPERVLSWVQRRWQQDGLFVFRVPADPGHLAMTGTDLRSGQQNTLLLFRERRRTVALLSRGVVGSPASVERDPELPAFEGAISLSRVDATDGGVRSSTYSYVVKQRRADHAQFLVTAFQALGWQGGQRKAVEGVKPDQAPLLFGKGARMCRAFIVPTDNPELCSVRMTVTRHAGGPTR